MAGGTVNKVILIGNLGADPEIRRFDNGTAVATFSLATSESYADKNTNERKTITDWHNIVAWRSLAEISEKHLKKGMKIYIEGKLKTRSYQDKENIQRYTTEVVAETLNIMTWADNDRSTNQSESQAKPIYPSDGPKINPIDNLQSFSSTEDDDLPF